MKLKQKITHYWFPVLIILLSCAVVWNCVSIIRHLQAKSVMAEGPLKWVDFNVTEAAMDKAIKLDIKSRETEVPLNWIDLIAYLGAKYGGDFKQYRAKHMDELVKKCKDGKTVEQLAQGMNYYPYYRKAYGAVLEGLVGEYQIQTEESYNNKTVEMQTKYGLKAYSPIPYGYSFSHYDDFGNSRSFGFTRSHLGHDVFGSIGTPVIAVESGIVETLGWNNYGGWRVGIKSLDGKRYYYYAHLRKGRPYHKNLKEGKLIEAGDIIGYLGMTGYSSKEDFNGMKVPHLHFGMQIIPEDSARESNHEIWIDVYEIMKLLEHHKSPVIREDETKEYYRKYEFEDRAIPPSEDKR